MVPSLFLLPYILFLGVVFTNIRYKNNKPKEKVLFIGIFSSLSIFYGGYLQQFEYLLWHIFSNLSIFCGLLLFVKLRKSIYCNVKNTFVQDILQRHSNKKADFRVKVALLTSPENRTKKEKKRTLPLGSQVGLGRQIFWRVKKCIYQ